MEQLANNGNGNYEYIDNLKQMKKIFIYDFMKFYTVAKDVKVQMNFNPNTVQSYRLIGYENRGLDTDDFEDDDEDAGELGVNQNVTALYEIQLASSDVKGEEPTATSEAIGELDFRYKQPNGASSTEFGVVIGNDPQSFESSSDFQKFTAAVASFAMLIRDSEYSGTSSFSNVISWLNECDLSDPHGFKAELKTLVSEASLIY